VTAIALVRGHRPLLHTTFQALQCLENRSARGTKMLRVCHCLKDYVF
jgi:hypothetical protein